MLFIILIVIYLNILKTFTLIKNAVYHFHFYQSLAFKFSLTILAVQNLNT